MENQIILDLDTLKYIQAVFNIHSDHSCSCNGYRSLENLIKGEEKANHNLTREDIESFGFKFRRTLTEGRKEYVKKAAGVHPFGTYHILLLHEDTVTLFHYDKSSAKFVGKIKNKSELRWILKALQILE